MNVTAQSVGLVLDFRDTGEGQVDLVGGKGANLAELARLDGLNVPRGFCVTTAAFDRIVNASQLLGDSIERLNGLKPDDRDAIETGSAEIRRKIASITIPADLTAAITIALATLGDKTPCAVRSSATAEDLPTASFAGQQDSWLNITGHEAVLHHVSLCWASLFTERAVTYRLRNGFDHRKVRMAVIVQQMVFPQAAGVLFTADPMTGYRKLSVVEATFGLGEALVSGLVNADVYKVRGDQITEIVPGIKQIAIYPLSEGGTQEVSIEAPRQQLPVLTNEQILRLVALGRRIEAHFNEAQDIEWCLANDEFHIVQSRPITTLFPIPAVNDNENHVYLSVGHQQMMTDPMKPLGLSLFQLTARPPMLEAAGRLFVDVAKTLSSPAATAGLLNLIGKSDPLTVDALQSILERGDFIRVTPESNSSPPPPVHTSAKEEPDPALIAELIAQSQASLQKLKHDIHTKSGTRLLDFIRSDIQELKRLLSDPRSLPLIVAAMDATWWLNEHMQSWLGEKNAADLLTQSVPNNITSEMGLALMEVADAIRPYPDVVSFLQQTTDDNYMDELPQLRGGGEAHDALLHWFEEYGMRCVGEIDITRPRWSECPRNLIPLILGNVRNFPPGVAARRFEQGKLEAAAKEHELLGRVQALPDGERKAAETKRMIDHLRTFSGYREYPKHGMICRYFIYKQALLGEAVRLLQAGVLREKEDIFYLRFEELQEAVRTHKVDHGLVAQRKRAHESYHALKPPRVLTSDGESVIGSFRRNDFPTGALPGLAASAGIVEGRARVVLDIADATLEAGDILVTTYTDPSWTPLFVTIKALVTEVGSLMTHGAVIAREYGLPAVVGVENATHLIRDGQRIRVNGSDGFVEVLS